MLKVHKIFLCLIMIFYKLFLRTLGKKGALRSFSLFIPLKLVIKVFFEEQPEELEDSFVFSLTTFLDVEDSIELLIPLGLSLLSILVEFKSSSDSSLTFSSSEKYRNKNEMLTNDNSKTCFRKSASPNLYI